MVDSALPAGVVQHIHSLLSGVKIGEGKACVTDSDYASHHQLTWCR